MEERVTVSHPARLYPTPLNTSWWKQEEERGRREIILLTASLSGVEWWQRPCGVQKVEASEWNEE